jgi:uncharacterized cofD-like protein
VLSGTPAMKIVGIGGGTGLPVLLRGLKQLRDRRADASGDDRVCAAAVVCVSDDGGSSGCLRRAFGIPAVGDLRNCMVALSNGNPTLRDIFQYRLCGDFGLEGHSLGNLIVAALSARSGNLRHAIRLASEFLGMQGEVLPCTEVNATLCAEFSDGEVVQGETRISERRKRIRRVWLDPPNPPAGAGVIDALVNADAIVFGPGSLHTSIVPNLFPAGVREALAASHALKIFVCNLTTQPGETEGYSASDHIRSLQAYLGRSGLHICLLNSRPVGETLREQYASVGSAPVVNDEDAIAQLGVTPLCLDLLAEGERELRHDPMKLARWIVALTRAFQRSCDLKAGEVSCFREAALAAN